MEKRNRNWLVFVIVGLVLYYGLPLVGKLLPAESGLLFYMAVLMLLNPAYCLVGSLVLAWKNGFRWFMPLVAAGLFVPALFLFYNTSAWLYLLAYLFLSLIGDFSGHILGRKPEQG